MPALTPGRMRKLSESMEEGWHDAVMSGINKGVALRRGKLPSNIEVVRSVVRKYKPSAATMSKIKKLSEKLEDLILFQTAEEIDAARRKHLRQTTARGALAAGAGFGGASYLLARPLLGNKAALIPAAIAATRAGAVGGAAGLGYGLLTRPKKIKPEEQLSVKLDRLINFAADTRPRNDYGEFTQQEGGPDPNAMYRTYHAPPPPKPDLLGTAATAAVGGSIGTAATLGTKGLIDRLKKVKLGRK